MNKPKFELIEKFQIDVYETEDGEFVCPADQVEDAFRDIAEQLSDVLPEVGIDMGESGDMH